MSDLSQVLHAAQGGDPRAAEQLLPLVYDELRKLAAARMAREAPGQTLQPTALVHEVWLRLTRDQERQWDNRSHFFGAAAEAMRRILIDNARRKKALCHGAGQPAMDIQQIELAAPAADDQLLAINEALDKFAIEHQPKADLVKMRFFAGMSLEETSDALGISEATAKRWWAYARAWLFSEINQQK